MLVWLATLCVAGIKSASRIGLCDVMMGLGVILGVPQILQRNSVFFVNFCNQPQPGVLLQCSAVQGPCAVSPMGQFCGKPLNRTQADSPADVQGAALSRGVVVPPGQALPIEAPIEALIERKLPIERLKAICGADNAEAVPADLVESVHEVRSDIDFQTWGEYVVLS